MVNGTFCNGKKHSKHTLIWKISDIYFILSTHWCTEGYWIEKGFPEPKDDEYIYSTEQEVRALYGRIKSGIEVDPNTGHRKVKGLIL